jgi:hypothetical protein
VTGKKHSGIAARVRNTAPLTGLLAIVAFSGVLGMGASIAGYVVGSDESLSANLATWARDHHLGAVVDELQQWHYGTPPDAVPASELETIAGSDSNQPAPVTPTTVPYAPTPITPEVTPALQREGTWTVARTIDGRGAIWVAGIRPLRTAPAVTATYAVIDQDLTYAGMWNGPEIPGNKQWRRYRSIEPALQPHLLAAFNGGFRREHTNGGYFTEGVDVWKMNPAAATLGIDKDGRIRIGLLGRDIIQSEMVSIRQNVKLLVDNSASVVGKRTFEFGTWKDGNLFIVRSAVCERNDGKLMFAIAGPADALQLATALVQAGCRIAMQLDVNAAWPKFSIYDPETPAPHTRWIDKRITGSSTMFLTGVPKDFFALFDRTMPDEQLAKLK